MNFNNFLFYPFFALVVIGNAILPRRSRWIWLLIASYFFYALSDIRYAVILLILTILSYSSGRLIANCKNKKLKHTGMVLSVLLHVGVLIVFNYLNFILDSIREAVSLAGLQFSITGVELIYPIGISFYILQVISYLLDVYSGKIEAERNFFQYALFVSFFPKLLIGPIERYNHLQPQLINPAPFEYRKFVDSLVRIGWGLFKKMVIADRLAAIANTVFANPAEFESPKLILAVYAFSFQIYIDFSAYSDIAIGTARILGVDLYENFNLPYLAKSVVDFWRRWHISLSNWLRDYVFLKLNYKNRYRKPREVWMGLNIMATFLISGLWHGANWTFIVWGALHGIYQTIEVLTQKYRDALINKLGIDRNALVIKAIQVLVTFGLVSFAWIFFRANSIPQALQIVRSIFTLDRIASGQAWAFSNGSLGLDSKDFGMMVFTLGLFLITEVAQRKTDLLVLLNQQPTWLRWTIYYALFFAITIVGFYGEASAVDFVYSQF